MPIAIPDDAGLRLAMLRKVNITLRSNDLKYHITVRSLSLSNGYSGSSKAQP